MKKQFYYKVFDIDTVKELTLKSETALKNFAKKQLRGFKDIGLDKELKFNDLDAPINAWKYLLHNGFAIKTNRKRW